MKKVPRRSRAGGPGERIRSILRAQALLFDSPLVGLELGVREDYRALLDFEELPELSKLRRVRSVLETHALVFADGLAGRDAALAAELPSLYAYLSSLERPGLAAAARSRVIPRTLGLSFAKKGLGAPLFGYYRPSRPPSSPGLVLVHQGIQAQGVARVAAAWTADGCGIEYCGLGARLGLRAPWLYCAIAPHDEPVAPDPILGPRGAFSGRATATFQFDRYDIAIAGAPRETTLRSAVMDPLTYRYPYFFFSGKALRPKLLRFLMDALVGSYGLASREAEAVALLFIGRLP